MKTKTTKKKGITVSATNIDKIFKSAMKKTGKLYPKITDTYTATVKIFGKVYTSTGSTVKEAIEGLKVGKVGGVCVMTVTHGENKKEKILNAGQLFRIFSSSRIMHEMAIKNVVNMFGDL